MVKYCFIDTETTGVIPEKNGLIQVSGAIEIENEVKEEFDFCVRPFSQDIIEEKALEVNRRTKAEIMEFEEPKFILKELEKIFNRYVDPYNPKDKFHFVAYNAMFDWNFMRQFFVKNNHKYFNSYFFFPPIDVMYLAADFLKEKRHDMQNFKLGTVAETMGIEMNAEALHDSLYDILITRQVYWKSLGRDVLLSSKEETVETPQKEEEQWKSYPDSLF